MKKDYPLVSIIIVNWNGLSILKECFYSLSKIDYPNWELILVDNGSKDGSLDFARSYKFPFRLRVIENKINLGFAEPNNQGYRISRGKYILLLNNDTKVNRDFLTKLVDRMEKDPKIGVCQPKIYLMEKPGYLDNTGSYITKTGLLKHEGFLERDSPRFDKEEQIFAAKGACMLIKREVIEKVGLFDKDFFAYFEESDFCWRAWIAGYKTIYCPDTHIFHKLGATSKKMNQFAVNYHSIKNRLASLIKNLQFRNLFTVLSLHFVILLSLCIFYLLRLQFGKFNMIVTAIWWNMIHLPNLLSKRRKTQKLRVVSDDEIFKLVGRKWPISQMLNHFGKVEANF